MAASMVRTCVLRDFHVLQNLTRYSACTSWMSTLRFKHSIRPADKKCTIPIYQVKPIQHQLLSQRSFSTGTPLWTSSEATSDATDGTEEDVEEYHSIIKNTERSRGPSDKHEFQAETRKLLDIVARSLYSEKEVFIRELISNSSDALEKLRYLQMKGEEIIESETPLEIHIETNDDKKTFTIQDTGIGMTKEEMMENLGTIARSGSKAFLQSVEEKTDVNSNIIGQFGVGFYSSFMVANKVDVYSRSYAPESVGYKWSSDGTGTYDIAEAEGCQRGTKICLQLRGECYNYAKEELIKEIIKKYSNFLGVPIYLNGKKTNVVQALWTMDAKEITEDMHEEFYRFVANVHDRPRFHFMFKTDAPIDIRSLLYVPEYKPMMFDRSQDVGIVLYSRKVMIMSKANHVLPKWLRFMKGVIDSEDIPLNLSRELLQDSSLIRKIRNVLTNRLLKFFQDCAKRDPESFNQFMTDYNYFFLEGIIDTQDQEQREGIAKLLRYESSKSEPGERVSLDDYTSRMKAGERSIYYLCAPSRELAESSPYLEAFQEKDVEVLFVYQPYDEFVMMNLGEFNKKFIRSIENKVSESKSDTSTVDETDENTLNKSQVETLTNWLKFVLQNRVQNVQMTNRLSSHPCVITVADMASARFFINTSLADKSQEERDRVLQATLEINPSHPLIKKLHILQEDNPDLARLLAEQLYDNAMIGAGLIKDPRTMVGRLNELLEKALDKH